MSLTVANIENKLFPISDETKDLCTHLGVRELLPDIIPKSMSFELHNTNTEMANAIRRCGNSEIEVIIMSVNTVDIVTDDTYIISHELRKRLRLIPISQISSITFELNVRNDTDGIIPVYSKSIVQTHEEKRKQQLFSGSFVLTYLRPSKRLSISNIHTTKGMAFKNGAEFSFPGKIGFECLDLDNKVSSLVAEPTRYKLSIPPQKYIEPSQIIKLTLRTLDMKFDKLYNVLKDTKNDIYTSYIEIVGSPGKTKYKIYDETYTMGYLLKRYCYNIDETISNINVRKPHPTFDHIVVTVVHSDPKKLMMSAITSIRNDLRTISSFF
jgi:DNA-directed RNA polymerase subunit L